MAIRGSSPVNVNLGMLDTRPAIQANAMVQQANVNLANSVNQAVNNFVQAKEKKENEQISINAIQSLLGISDPNLAKAIVKDPAVGKAFQFQQEQEQIKDDRELKMTLAMLSASPKGTMMTESMLKEMYPSEQFDYTITPQGLNEQGENILAVKNISPRAPVQEEPPGEITASVFQETVSPLIGDTRAMQTKLDQTNLGIKLLKEGMETGFAESLVMKFKSAANRLGIGEDFDISNQELFQNVVGPRLLDYVAQTKGAISNREFATFEGWSASIDKTAEGNLKILEVTRRIAQRELDVARYTKKLLSEDPVYTQSIQGTFKLQAKVEEYIEKLASDPKTNIYGVTDMSFDPVTTTVPDGVGAYIGD
jgi:hypothetical protein